MRKVRLEESFENEIGSRILWKIFCLGTFFANEKEHGHQDIVFQIEGFCSFIQGIFAIEDIE